MVKKEAKIAGHLARVGIRTPAVLVTGLLMFAVPASTSSQEESHAMESVADASRNAREHRGKSTKPARLFTNEDLIDQKLVANGSGSTEGAANAAGQASTSKGRECDNPEAAKLRAELQATARELDQVRSEFSDRTSVISGNNLDLKSYKPGHAGLDVGTRPVSDSAPPVPARMTALQLEERITALNRALSIACESPEAAEIQLKIDEAETQLDILQRQFALDNENHYSKPNYSEDTAGKAKLDAESREVESRQSEVARLRDELAAVKQK